MRRLSKLQFSLHSCILNFSLCPWLISRPALFNLSDFFQISVCSLSSALFVYCCRKGAAAAAAAAVDKTDGFIERRSHPIRVLDWLGQSNAHFRIDGLWSLWKRSRRFQFSLHFNFSLCPWLIFRFILINLLHFFQFFICSFCPFFLHLLLSKKDGGSGSNDNNSRNSSRQNIWLHRTQTPSNSDFELSWSAS